MYKIYIYILLSMVLFVTSCSQKKDDFNDFAKRNVASIAVSFPNATNDAAAGAYYQFRRSTIGTAPSSTPVAITIAIPTESGRTIKAVFAVVGTTALNAGSVSAVTNPTTGLTAAPAATAYWISTNTTPVRPALPTNTVVSGLNTSTVTINTTVGDITTAGGVAALFHTTAIPANPGFLEAGSIYRLVLDDNTEIVTTLVRLRVLP